MRINMRLFDCVLLLPLVTLITLFPLSVGGWGVREGAMIVALGFVSVSATSAFSLSVLYGLVILASGIPGAFVWLTTGKRLVPSLAQHAKSNDDR
jgi:hypothetical protein